MNQQQDEIAAAQQLKAVLGGLNFSEFGWVRVVQVLFRHIQWVEINEALKVPDHESVLGAINNLRQIESLGAGMITRLRKDFGRLFEMHFTFVNGCDCGNWSPEREKTFREMIELIQRYEIPVCEQVSKQLKADYPSLWRERT